MDMHNIEQLLSDKGFELPGHELEYFLAEHPEWEGLSDQEIADLVASDQEMIRLSRVSGWLYEQEHRSFDSGEA